MGGASMTTEEIAGESAKAVLGEVLQAAKDDPNMKMAGSNLAKSAATVTQTVNTLLLPLAALNFGVERAKEYFQSKFGSDMAAKLSDTPEEEIVEPKLSLAGPALQGLAFAHEEADLKDMFLNLIVSAMKQGKAELAHPSYVEVIKQLSSFDAKMASAVLPHPQIPISELRVSTEPPNYRVVRKCLPRPVSPLLQQLSALPEAIHSIENLQRLGLITLRYDVWLASEAAYNWVERHPIFLETQTSLGEGKTLEFGKGILQVTEFGDQFRRVACPTNMSGYVTSKIKV
jgi:Abortive infection alpha